MVKRLKLRSFKLKVQKALPVTLAAGVFALVALTTQTPSKSGLVPSLKALAQPGAHSLQPEIQAAQERAEKTKALFAQNELYRQLESGTRSLEEIQTEISDIASRSEGTDFSSKKIDRAYKLSMVLSHYKKKSQNPYEVLFIHSFANNGLPEDAVTLYTRRIDGAEENLTKSQIVTPRQIVIDEKGSPAFDVNSSRTYQFALEPNRIKRVFDQRDPEGLGGFSSTDAKDFDPLSILKIEGAQFENGAYSQELLIDGDVIKVQITIRKTEIGTLTFDIKTQKVNSDIEQNFLLVYEEL